MSLDSKLSLALLLILATVFFSGSFSRCCSWAAEEEQASQFIFIVALREVDWVNRTIDAPIELWFLKLPDNFRDEKGQYNFSSITVEFEQWHNTGQVQLFPREEGSQINYS